MSEYTDIRVRTKNPEALDKVMVQLGACVIEGTWHNGICLVRVFGNPGFVKFAIKNQGYGEVIRR